MSKFIMVIGFILASVALGVGASWMQTGFRKNEIIITDTPPFYAPLVLEIRSGTKVTWVSKAEVVHPVATLLAPVRFHSGHFTKSWSHTFSKPGMYYYFCTVHPYMVGIVAVDESKEEIEQAKKSLHFYKWPPELPTIPGAKPETPGEGSIWLSAQFQKVEGQKNPGASVVVDASTWDVKKVVTNERFNNPHNMWPSPDGTKIYQTNWFGKYVSVIDASTYEVVDHIWADESPAHVLTSGDKIYITGQGSDAIFVVNSKNYDDSIPYRTNIPLKEGSSGEDVKGVSAHEGENEGFYSLDFGKGPHGHWMSSDGSLMAVAATEGNSLSVFKTGSMEKIFEAQTDPLPLFAGISPNGKYAWTASSRTGRFEAYDVKSKKKAADFVVGKGPIQSVPSPDGKYILVANSGDGEVAVVNGETFKVVKKLFSGAGAHAVTYGPKKGQGTYAYISNKFVNWITVIDMESLEVAGFIPLPKESLGGQGILWVK